MAFLNGHNQSVQMVGVAAPAAVPVAGDTTRHAGATTTGTGAQIIDGTPVRVGVIALMAAGGLLAFKMAGLRFNVGVSA